MNPDDEQDGYEAAEQEALADEWEYVLATAEED